MKRWARDKWLGLLTIVLSSVLGSFIGWNVATTIRVLAQSGTAVDIQDTPGDARRLASGMFVVAASLSDSLDQAEGCSHGFMIDTTGAVKFQACNNKTAQAVTLNNLSPGVVYPISVRRVWANGTAATVYLIY